MTKRTTREQIDDFIDATIDQFEELIEVLGEDAEFECPITGKKLKGNEVIDYLDEFTRERMYEECGILDAEEAEDAYKRAMKGI